MRRVLPLLVLLATPLAAQPPATPALTAHQQLARAVYKELVEINTVDSVGSTTRAAQAMAARFRAAGFPAADVQVLVPPGKPTKGNLVVRYRGRGQGKPILLLAHIDVVAANRSDWPRDPFVLHEENGYFLGRGTADDKAMAAMFVANLLKWKREGWTPDRDLVLALTADEEGGDANGVEWLLAKHRPLIDAAYAINEGGGGALDGPGPDARPLRHSVQAAEKVPEDYTLTARNPGGHSSVPRPDNAIYQLTDAIGRIARHRFPVALNPVSRAFFEQQARVEKPEMAAAMRAVVADPTDTAAAAIVARDPAYNSMLRTTCVATMLQAGHARNALPQKATANVNCRILPQDSVQDVQRTLVRVFADDGIKVTLRSQAGAPPAPVSTLNPIVIKPIEELTGKMWKGVTVIPIMGTGATDSAYLRAKGIPMYGVSGLFGDIADVRAHGRDERVGVAQFYDSQDFLYRLVKRYATGK